MDIQHIAKDKELFDIILEETCRQWCDGINDAPERKDGEGFADFFYEIVSQKADEYRKELDTAHNRNE